MTDAVGKPERATQNRVIALFKDELGYRFLGDWSDRENSNVDEGLLAAWLKGNGATPEQIAGALYKLRTEAGHPGRTLYENNKAVHSLLRYGVSLKTEVGQVTQTIDLINWKEPLLRERYHLGPMPLSEVPNKVLSQPC